MKKLKAGIFLFNNVEVLDFAGPFEVFSVASELHDHQLFEVFTFAKKKEPVLAVNGLSVNPAYDFLSVPDTDLLIIPGGDGTNQLIQDSELIRELGIKGGKALVTMTVCSGARVPAVLGWLANKPYCTHHLVYESIQQLAPSSKAQRDLRYVQSDEKLYTSGGISAGIDLSFHILHNLYGSDVVRKTAEYMEYRLENPV